MNLSNMTITEVPYIDTRMGFFYDVKDQGQLRDGEKAGTLWVRDFETDQVSMYLVTESDYKLFCVGFKTAFCFSYLREEDILFIDRNYNHYLLNHENDVVIVPVQKRNNDLCIDRDEFHHGKVLERQTM